MTATEVNGVKVKTDTPTLAPITTPNGKAIWWEQTRTLTLEDGSIVYGCLHCDHTATKAGAIRPHLRQHADPDKPKPAKKDKTALAAVSKRLRRVETLEEQVKRWKTRALTAERKISQWEQDLISLGFTPTDNGVSG